MSTPPNSSLPIKTTYLYISKHPFSQFPPEISHLLTYYKCLLCNGLAYPPVLDTCNHLFCKECFALSYSQSQTCPITALPLQTTATVIKVIESNLSRYEIYCKHREQGCLWKDKISQYEQHINVTCPYEIISCPNEGCSLQSKRSDVEQHMMLCVYRLDECEWCSVKVKVVNMKSHRQVCPRMKVECRNACGMKVERNEMDKHVKEECMFEKVGCVFRKYGCGCKEMLRKDLKEYMKSNMDKHVEILVKVVEGYERKMEVVEKEYRELRGIVERQGNMINVLNRAREYKEGIGNNVEGNYTNNKEDKGSNSNSNSNGSRYGNRNYCNIMNTNKVIFHSQKTTTSSNTNNNNTRVDSNVPPLTTTNVNNNTQVVAQQRNNPINHNPSFISRKTFRSNTPPQPPKCISTNIFTKPIINPEHFIITNNIIRYIGITRCEHRYIFLNKTIDINSSLSKFRWTIRLLTTSPWLGIGLCDSNQVAKNNFKFSSNDAQRNHGSFLISSNKYSWNCNVSTENNKLISISEMKKGEEIKMEYDLLSKRLSFEINGTMLELTCVVPVFPGEKLTPCVVFLHKDDVVEVVSANF